MTDSQTSGAGKPLGPSRRDFLVGSVGAVFAGYSGGPRGKEATIPLGRGPAEKPDLDRALRVALIGCGGRGTGAALQALRTKGDVRLLAMADLFPDRLQESLSTLRSKKDVVERIDVPEERQFVGFDAYQKALGPDIDVVVLATPPHFRPEHFQAAIQATKHVFMEKPVAVDGYGVRTVLEAAALADERKLCVQVGLQRHHQLGYQETMRRIHAGAIGEIVAARAYWNQRGLWKKDRQPKWTDMEWQLRNWLYFAWLSGDHIVEQHIHNLDVINWAKQAHPVFAQGMGGRQVRTGKAYGHIYDHHAVQYQYEDGSWLFSECRQIDGCRQQVSEHLIGTKGRCDMDTRKWTISGQEDWSYKNKNDPFQTEHDDLFLAIRTGEQVNEARYGAESSLTAIMGRMATYTGQRISWEQALNSERLGPKQYVFGDLPTPPVAVPGS